MQVKAAVLRDPAGPYAIETVELAAPAADEVLVRIVGAGMCHTDVLPRTGLIAPPPVITGQASMPADISATAISIQLSNKNFTSHLSSTAGGHPRF